MYIIYVYNILSIEIFYVYENIKLTFLFFISCYFIFSPNEFPGLWNMSNVRHSLGEK